MAPSTQVKINLFQSIKLNLSYIIKSNSILTSANQMAHHNLPQRRHHYRLRDVPLPGTDKIRP